MEPQRPLQYSQEPIFETYPSQINPTHVFPFPFPKINSNTTIWSTPTSFQSCLLFKIPNYNCVRIYHFLHERYMSGPSHPLGLIILITSDEECELRIPSVWQTKERNSEKLIKSKILYERSVFKTIYRISQILYKVLLNDWNWMGHISFWPMLMTLIFWEKT
jgi:hypothetical protein